MATNIVMPQLGLTMTEGTIMKWYKKEGDQVKTGEVLAEIATDKITNELEAPEDGVLLKITAEEGQCVPVKATIAVIGAAGESVVQEGPAGEKIQNEEEKSPQCAETAVPEKENTKARANAGEWIKASPAARKLARDKGIELADIVGTGPGGRIVERDVLACEEKGASSVTATPLAKKTAKEYGLKLEEIAKEGRITEEDVLAAIKRSTPSAETGAGESQVVALTPIRKVIAQRMSESWNTAPHVTLSVDVDMTMAGKLKENLQKATEKKYSYTEIIVKCVAQTLQDYEEVNASWTAEGIKKHKNVNVGVAVAIDSGLVVPVIRDAQRKNISGIREDLASIVERARSGNMLPDDMQGGTFTVTNLGMFGVDHFTPIINPPESAILGVCRIVKKPVVIGENIEIRPIMTLCLSFDHRVIDGALAAKFMQRVRQYLEEPMLLI